VILNQIFIGKVKKVLKRTKSCSVQEQLFVEI